MPELFASSHSPTPLHSASDRQMASPRITVPSPLRTNARTAADASVLRVVKWLDPIADPHGVHPCSRYVELYWLPAVGPSTTWLLRRVSYGLELSEDGFELDLVDTARSLGLGDRMGKNSPFHRAIRRLATFDLARAAGPGALAVRTQIPPLPLRHLRRLPQSLQASHHRWLSEQNLSEPERMRRRARRLATDLANAGHTRQTIEGRLATWHFHPSVAFSAADDAVRQAAGGPGPRSEGPSARVSLVTGGGEPPIGP
jgi:hypothetical protein